MSDVSFRALGALLSYPVPELTASVTEIRQTLAVGTVLSGTTVAGLNTLLEHLATKPLLDLEEEYVATFDRDARASLFLYEHLYGQARDRGPALIELRRFYGHNGWEQTGAEFPDYLPLICEFLSLSSPVTVTETVVRLAPALTALSGYLTGRRSPYAAVPAAIAELAGNAADRNKEA